MAEIPTMNVYGPAGHLVINASDFSDYEARGYFAEQADYDASIEASQNKEKSKAEKAEKAKAEAEKSKEAEVEDGGSRNSNRRSR